MKGLFGWFFVFGIVFLPGVQVFSEEAGEGGTDFDLGQVVVTGTKTEHTLADVPVPVDVVTREDFTKRNVRTVQEALDLLPGLRISRNSGSWGDKGHVSIQGMDSKHTLVLLDGQRFEGGHSDAVDLQQISLDMIDRIEVVKGPASALYGSDAVAGVVNIITKSSPDKPFVSFDNMIGSRDTGKYSVTAGGAAGKLGAIVNYSYDTSAGVHETTDKYLERVFHGTFDYRLSPDLKYALKPYYSEHRQKEDGRRQERTGLNSVMEWNPDELSKLTLRGSMFNYQHWTADKSSNWDEDTYESELNYSRLLFDRHTVTGGYHFTRESHDDKGKSYSARQKTNSYFVQDEIVLDPFTFIVGTRIDDHDKWETQVNPKFGLLYAVNEDLKLRGSVGTAFRGPSLTKLYADGWRMGPYRVHANPDLKPEESTGWQVGGEYRFWEMFLTRLSFFRNDLKNLISSKVVRAGYPYDMYWVNVDKAMTRGVEFSLNTFFSESLKADIGYTFLDTEDKSTHKELTEKPKHKLSLELGYKIPVIDVWADFEVKYTGRAYADSDNTNRLGGYTIFNLALSRDINPSTQVFVRAENLSGKKDVYSDYDLDGTEFMSGIRMRF